MEFEQLIHGSGDFTCTKDEDGKIGCISFCRNEQVELFGQYPEVVCMDATYNVNRSR